MAKAAVSRRNRTQNLGLKTREAKPGSTLSTAGWIVCAGVALIPLCLITGFFLSHDVVPKVALLSAVAGALLFLPREWMGNASLVNKVFLWIMAAQASVLALSTIFSSQTLLSLVGTTWRRFGMIEQLAILVIALATAACAIERELFARNLWRLTTVSAGIASIYGIAQYFGVDPFLDRKLYALDYLGGLVRPPATMGHAIYFSAYLAPVALIAAWRSFSEQDRTWRFVSVACAVLAPLAILLSGSRGALLGYLAGAIMLLGKQRPSRNAVIVGCAATIAVAVFIAFAPGGENLRHRIQQWREDPGSVRIAVWRETPALISEHPLFGSGPETFGNAFRRIESAALSRAYPDFINETPHNIFVDAASEEGFGGLIVLVALLLFGILRTKSAGIRAALVAAAVCGFFASFSIVSALYVWIFAAIVAAENATLRPSVKRIMLAPVAIAAGVAFLLVAGILAVQDAAYAELRNAVDSNDSAAARRAELNATSYGIGLPGYELWSSQQLARIKAWDDAINAASLAQQRGEDQAGAAYQGSILKIVAADAPGAEARAREAIGFAPNWYKPHLLRAQILQAMGRNAEAAQEMQEALSLGWKGK